MKNNIDLLDEIRAIAQNGLCYADNEYDRIRYEVLLQVASREYSNICGLDEKVILERFKNELGYITPKVGVNGVVFTDEGKILLERRADDNQWGIPGGWSEVGESPEESVKREIYEETGLKVEVKGIIDIFTRLPGEYRQPHTTYHILYHCEVIGGELKKSFESSEVGFYNYNEISKWHKDHSNMAKKACNLLKYNN